MPDRNGERSGSRQLTAREIEDSLRVRRDALRSRVIDIPMGGFLVGDIPALLRLQGITGEATEGDVNRIEGRLHERETQYKMKLEEIFKLLKIQKLRGGVVNISPLTPF